VAIAMIKIQSFTFQIKKQLDFTAPWVAITFTLSAKCADARYLVFIVDTAI
jgi:hypothetical protein